MNSEAKLGLSVLVATQLLEEVQREIARAAQATFDLTRHPGERMKELGADFDVEAFDFRATYDELRGTVESHLVSRQDQIVTIKELDLRVSVRADETIHTESSFKYSLGEIDSLANTADLELAARWLDSKERFSLNLFAAAPSAASK